VSLIVLATLVSVIAGPSQPSCNKFPKTPKFSRRISADFRHIATEAFSNFSDWIAGTSALTSGVEPAIAVRLNRSSQNQILSLPVLAFAALRYANCRLQVHAPDFDRRGAAPG
jgi:hypothetical protein